MIPVRPGDVVLFSRQGFYNRLIQAKTWSRVSHVEVVAQPGTPGTRTALPMTVASRNGRGVGYYPFDDEGLHCVLRPVALFDQDAAWRWFLTVNGQGYDWVGLVAFLSAKWQGKENGRQFCSEFATRYLRAGGIDPFNGYDADGISPGEFLKSPVFVRLDAAAGV
jgi:hypothetical protein